MLEDIVNERLVLEDMDTSGSCGYGMSVVGFRLIPCYWGDYGGTVGLSEPKTAVFDRCLCFEPQWGGSHVGSIGLGFVVGRAMVWCTLGCSVGRSRGPMFEQDWGWFVGEVFVSWRLGLGLGLNVGEGRRDPLYLWRCRYWGRWRAIALLCWYCWFRYTKWCI